MLFSIDSRGNGEWMIAAAITENGDTTLTSVVIDSSSHDELLAAVSGLARGQRDAGVVMAAEAVVRARGYRPE